MAIAGGLLLGFGAPELIKMVPPEIRIGPKGVLWSRYKSLKLFERSTIHSCQIRRVRLGTDEYCILVLGTNHEGTVIFGMPVDGATGTVIDAFSQIGIAIQDLTADPPIPFETVRQRG
jgi:hypothetical protein